jgi:two-component system, OmpR family, sensor histidine kinase KdpD
LNDYSTLSESVRRFLDMLRTSKAGKLKIYIGMAAGVGKTYRMLQEARQLRENGIDVQIGYVETHGRKETANLIKGIPIIPRKSIFYKGKQLEEMDIDGVLAARPAVVLVDELAHTNIPSSRHEKRWQDVKELIEAGISVISTVNIQHIESINQQVESITGVKISERVPDSILQMADEAVNVDLTIDELIDRLQTGKIYDQKKARAALQNFFQVEKLLQLRELALREVSRQVERKIIKEIPIDERQKLQAIVTAISTNAELARMLIRKSSRLASLYHSNWYVVHVQVPKENPSRIDPEKQRHLINNLKLAIELGAQVVQISDNNVARAIVDFAKQKEASLVIAGKPQSSFLHYFLHGLAWKFIEYTNKEKLDLLMVTLDENT